MFGRNKFDELAEAVRGYAQLLVDCGFYGRMNYKTEVVRHFLDYDMSARQERQFDKMIDGIYERRLVEQQSWGVTSAEVLEAAFEDLRRLHNVVVYEFLGSDQADAHRYANMQKDALIYDGYAFFTRKDAKQLVWQGGTPLSFGAYGRDVTESSHLAIAQQVVRVLREHGFTVSWDGGYESRILVEVGVWQRKLEPEATWPTIDDTDFLLEPAQIVAVRHAWATGNPNEARGYRLENAVQLAAEHPETFTIPDQDWRDHLWVGEGVKLIFTPLLPVESDPVGERMWVRIVDLTRQDFIVGELWNEPDLLTHLVEGEVVLFRPENIINIASENVGDILE